MSAVLQLILLAHLATLPHDQAALEIVPPVLDFGTVLRDAELQRRVRLTNRGTRELVFDAVDSDCVCLRGCPNLRSLAPGASCDWPITLHSCDYVGEVRRSVSIASGARRWLIPTRYRVVEPLIAQPATAGLGIVALDESEEQVTRVLLHTAGAQPIRLLGVQVSDPQRIAAELSADRLTNAAPVEVLIRLLPPFSSGTFEAAVVIHSDQPDMPALRIPVLAECVHGARGDRGTIAFEPVPFGQRRSARFTISTKPAVEVRDVRSASDCVAIAGVQRAPAQTVIELRTQPNLPLGEFQSQLLVELFESGTSRRVRVPIRGQVVEPH